jgi:thiol-disulfide isomerase/thioredoxin
LRGALAPFTFFRKAELQLSATSVIIKHMRFRIFPCLLLLSSLASAGIVDDTRTLLAENNVSAADSQLQAYRTQHGVDPEYLEALSWVARAQLAAQNYDQAYSEARQVHLLSLQQLKRRKLDAEPHLPMALGAAYEVEAEVLSARKQAPKAILLLKSALQTYGNTSIAPRLQKNLNLMVLAGKPAPPLKADEYFGPIPPSLAQLKGSPVLLFFWAHWCVDCKAEGPIITQLRSEFGPKGLAVIAPTQRYGYAAGGADATPQQELQYIRQIWQHYYAGLQDVSVPVSHVNFKTYGASTTPTLVLINRSGHVSMYHPGAMAYQDLRGEIEKVVQN